MVVQCKSIIWQIPTCLFHRWFPSKFNREISARWYSWWIYIIRTQLSTNFILNTSDERITLGSSNDVVIIDTNEGIQIGNSTFANAEFSVDVRGNLKAESGSIGGFDITDSFISGAVISILNATNGTIESADFSSVLLQEVEMDLD